MREPCSCVSFLAAGTKSLRKATEEGRVPFGSECGACQNMEDVQLRVSLAVGCQSLATLHPQSGNSETHAGALLDLCLIQPGLCATEMASQIHPGVCSCCGAKPTQDDNQWTVTDGDVSLGFTTIAEVYCKNDA